MQQRGGEELRVSVFYAMIDAFVKGIEAMVHARDRCSHISYNEHSVPVALISAIMNIQYLTATIEEIDAVIEYFGVESVCGMNFVC